MNYATGRVRNRVDWCEVLLFWFGGTSDFESFKQWCIKHKYVKSDNKKAYCFLLKKCGRSWIRIVRASGGVEGLQRIVHTKWIKGTE